jgi:PAS domain S-box-containing protein
VPLDRTYGLGALLDSSTALRTVGDGATSMETAATEAVGYLRSHFVDKSTGGSALPLVRFYLTQRVDRLEPALQDFAFAAGSDSRFGPDVVCLTLFATAGEEHAWNDRHRSAGHRAIPLPSIESVHRMPMVSQLIQRLRSDHHRVDGEPPRMAEADTVDDPYDVVYVADARDHPAVPAQGNFVIPYGIRSAIAFGGALPDGEAFAIVAFSRVPIPASAVDGFAACALSARLALLRFAGGPVFEGRPAPPLTAAAAADLDRQRLEWRAQTAEQLLVVRGAMVEREAARLEAELAGAEERSVALADSQAALALSEARKAAIVEGALDCVIGMDADGCITEFNHAAETTFGYARADVLGERLGDVLVPPSMRQRHRLGLLHHRETGEGPIIGRRIEVQALHRDGHEFPVELTVTQIADADPPMFTGYVRDLTAARKAASDLAATHERLAHIARTLQTSLLPPKLPEIDGYELAAAYHAMGEGYDVGGDFYDAFELKDGCWALTLGDVCGKGSEAAAVTALTRYTLRAAAMRSDSPLTVLETVHDAVHREGSSRFCTAAYADLAPESGEVRLVLGGHPKPAVLTAAGEVRRVGIHGHLLGSFPHWKGTTDTMVLEPGDLLLLFSDGVVEARRDGDLFGDARLEETLRAARGLDAVDVVEALETAVLDFAGSLNDDVAVLALRRAPAAAVDVAPGPAGIPGAG